MTSRKSSVDSFNSLAAVRWPSISTAAQLYIAEYSQWESHFSPPVTGLGRRYTQAWVVRPVGATGSRKILKGRKLLMFNSSTS
jgi:hypothetical protein